VSLSAPIRVISGYNPDILARRRKGAEGNSPKVGIPLKAGSRPLFVVATKHQELSSRTLYFQKLLNLWLEFGKNRA